MSFKARFRSKCNDVTCEGVEPGDEVTVTDYGLLYHVRCAPVAERPGVICTKCYLQKPCGCDD